VNVLLQRLVGFFRRNPFVVIASLLAVLLWVGNYFVWRRHQELAAGHQTLQRSGEDMLQALTGHSRITSELAAVKEALAFIDQHLIHEGDLPENMGYFYQLEASSRLRLASLNQLSSAPPPPDQPFKTVPFTLRTIGTYRQVLRLVRELESAPRLFKVQTYSFAQGGTAGGPPGGAGGETNLVTLDLTIEVLAHP
jgi:Tfp pilus assembly protein PilO